MTVVAALRPDAEECFDATYRAAWRRRPRWAETTRRGKGQSQSVRGEFGGGIRTKVLVFL